MESKVYDFKLTTDGKLADVIGEIDHLNSRWKSIEQKESKKIKQLKTIAILQSVGASTRIEGSNMTNETINDLLKNTDTSKSEDKHAREAIGYFEALNKIIKSAKTLSVTETDIKNIHGILMKHSLIEEKYKGHYKTQRNSVEIVFPSGKQTIFRTADAGSATENALKRLIEWYHKDQTVHPLIKIATFIYEFLSIHPFQEGNGNLSRLLSTFLLLKNEYKWVICISLEQEIEKYKNDYYQTLRYCQTLRPNENITDWVLFFLKNLNNIQSQLMNNFTQRGVEVRLSPREQLIISVIQKHPNIQSGEVAKRLGLPSPSVKRTLAGLLVKGVVKRGGSGNVTSYWLR